MVLMRIYHLVKFEAIAIVLSLLSLLPSNTHAQDGHEFMSDNVGKFYDAGMIASKLDKKIGLRGSTVVFALDKLIQERFLCGLEFPLNIAEDDQSPPVMTCKSEGPMTPRCPIAMLTLGVDWNSAGGKLSGYLRQFREARVRYVRGFCPYEPQRSDNLREKHEKGEGQLDFYLKNKSLVGKTTSAIVSDLLADGFMCGQGEGVSEPTLMHFVCARWPSQIAGCYEARLHFSAIVPEVKRPEVFLWASNAKVNSVHGGCKNPPLVTPPVQPLRQ